MQCKTHTHTDKNIVYHKNRDNSPAPNERNNSPQPILLVLTDRSCSRSKQAANPICILVWQIKLEVSTEFLVRIAGFYGPIEGNDSFNALTSITFYTNKTKYGPFGDEIDHAFTTSVAPGKVAGFHGRSDVYLDAIGAHMEYF